MNRRDLLRRAFAVGAAGLMLPVVDPVRKTWALDRTMILRSDIRRMTDSQLLELEDQLRSGRGDRVNYMVYDEVDYIGDWILISNRPESILRMYNFSTD